MVCSSWRWDFWWTCLWTWWSRTVRQPIELFFVEVFWAKTFLFSGWWNKVFTLRKFFPWNCCRETVFGEKKQFFRKKNHFADDNPKRAGEIFAWKYLILHSKKFRLSDRKKSSSLGQARCWFFACFFRGGLKLFLFFFCRVAAFIKTRRFFTDDKTVFNLFFV